ncbi:MAG: hypothetical protein AAF670_00340 [Planctomycetota bacterium]
MKPLAVPIIAILVGLLSTGAAGRHVVQADTIEEQMVSGPVSVKLTIEPESPVIGDTITLLIEVIAEEGVEVLMPDFGDALDRFSIVDFAPRESIDDQGRTIAKQTYRLDPPSSGRQVIPPILIEYVDRRDGQRRAPEGLDAYEVLTERMVFEVASVLPENASDELRPPLGELAAITQPSRSWWPWWLATGVVSIAVLPFAIRAIAGARRLRRRRSAYEVARSRMRTLLQSPRETTEQIDEFYVGLTYVIRQYIEDRFETRAPDLTTEEFLSSISQSPDFSTDHQGLLREFLRQADLVKFAGAQPSPGETSRAIEKAERFLDETRENAPMLAGAEETVSPGDGSSPRRPAEASYG